MDLKLINDKKLQEKIAFAPHKSQEEVLKAFKTKRDILICAGRRWGKSMLCAYLVLRTLLADNQEIAVISPSYDLTERILDYLRLWIHKGFPSSPKFQTRPFPKISMDSWGSYVEGKSAENPEGILGKGYSLVVVDEAARISRKVYEQYIYPALTSKQGKVIMISTPLGKNWFYERWIDAKESKDGSAFQFDSKDNPYFLEKEWLRAKQKMPSDVFEQEFQAVFREGSASVFRGVRDCVEDCLKPPEEGHYYIMGLDLAKFRDFSVITIIDTDTRKVVYWDRFQKIPYTLQRRRIAEKAGEYNNARVVVDSLNIGASLGDELRAEGVWVEDFKMTGTISKDWQKKGSKERLVEKLSSFLEQKEIAIPAQPILIDELESYGYTITDSGNLKYSAPQGLHDDAVDSLALAVWSLRGKVPKKPTIIEEALKFPKNRKKSNRSFI